MRRFEQTGEKCKYDFPEDFAYYKGMQRWARSCISKVNEISNFDNIEIFVKHCKNLIINHNGDYDYQEGAICTKELMIEFIDEL